MGHDSLLDGDRFSKTASVGEFTCSNLGHILGVLLRTLVRQLNGTAGIHTPYSEFKVAQSFESQMSTCWHHLGSEGLYRQTFWVLRSKV